MRQRSKLHSNVVCHPWAIVVYTVEPTLDQRRNAIWVIGYMVEVDLGDGHGNYSMPMYVADITDNCILGRDYLKAREAAIDLNQIVLVVNSTIVKGKYKYGESTPVRTHKVRLVNDRHIFSKFSE